MAGNVRGFRTILLAALLLFALISFSRACYTAIFYDRGSLDLQWWGTTKVIHGENPYQIYLDYLDRKPEIPNPVFMAQVPNYPGIAYVIMLPIGVLDWADAKIVFLLINLACVMLSVLALYRLYPVSAFHLYLIVCLLVASTPFRLVIANGQGVFLCVCALLWAVYFARQGRYMLSGLLICVSLVKYTIALPLLGFFVFMRWYKPLFYSAVFALIASQLLALWVGANLFRMLVDPVLVALTDTTGRGYLDIGYIFHLLSVENWVAYIARLTIIALCVYVAFVRSKFSETSFLIVLVFATCAIVFHLNYDFVLLIIPAWLMLGGYLKVERREKIVFWIVLSLIWYLERVALGAGELLEQWVYWSTVVFFYLSFVLFARLLIGVPNESGVEK